MMEQRDIREHITHEPRRHHDYSVRVPDNQIPWGDGLTTDRDGSAEFSCMRLRSRTGPDALEARMLCGPSIKCVRATKGDGAAFPGEADCIEVELADRPVRGCYLVGKAVAVN